MQNRNRLAVLVAIVAIFAMVGVASPAHAAKRAYHNHGRHAHHVKAQVIAAVTTTISTGDEPGCAPTGTQIDNPFPDWTRQQVDAHLGSAGVRIPANGCDVPLPAGCTADRYGWVVNRDGVRAVLVVAFCNNAAKAASVHPL